MKRRAFLILSFIICHLSFSVAQVIDRVTLGNAESEALHGLTTYCPAYTQQTANGLQGQTGRNCLMFDQNPFCGDYKGIYGGEYCFVMKVDGTRQNYLTLKTNGGDGVRDYERYHIQVDNRNLQDYQREAVSFSTEKAPGGFAFSTLVLPRRATDGKTAVVVRVRSLGHYYAYGTPTQFATYQYAMTGDMPPIYAVYTSTDPNVQVGDEAQGSLSSYGDATAQPLSLTLEALKTKISSKLKDAIKSQIEGSDFKPAYQNNNFNIVEAMGVAYQKGIYGTTATALASKIRVAIDSMVYINNLCKAGTTVSVSAVGNTKTKQIASEGWGGLFGNQGYGLYLLWKAGKVTTVYLNNSVDLGNGSQKRRDQWIAAFKESLAAGCTYSGRRHITNQAMEASYSVYGAALALYALDPQTYHNAPRMAHRFIREALGLEEWTGVPKNARFDGSLLDAEGYPTYELGDPASHNTSENFWGEHFHMMTAKGNGREEGWTCASCYGNMGQRICDMYLISKHDPYLEADGGDADILAVAVQNEKQQAYFTYPRADQQGHRVVSSESATCWRNRYDPGRPYYNNLIVAALSGDEELMGHVWQGYLEGHVACADDADYRLFPYYQHSYYLPEAIDQLIAYGQAHAADYQPMPSTTGQPDYVAADEQDGIVAVKHGDNYLFVNFYSEMSLGSSGKAHLLTPHEVRLMSFIPEVMKYTPSGQTTTAPEEYINSNHRITYPDHPLMANGGTQYDLPAYDTNGNYNASRQLCDYYQQQLGQYLVAQNTTADRTFPLVLSGSSADGQTAIDLATGQTVTLSEAITLAPRTTKVYSLTPKSLTPKSLTPNPSPVGEGSIYSQGRESRAETSAAKLHTPLSNWRGVGGEASGGEASLASRVSELTVFAQTASELLATDERPGYYQRDAFMPFFRELTMAAYVAATASSDDAAGLATRDSMLNVLNTAYATFAATQFAYEACAVPGTLDYTKKVATSGAVQVKSKTSVQNAKSGAALYLPIVAAKTGVYTIKVKAKSHVADQYKSSLNLSLFTQEQYYNGQTASDDSQTQVIAYDAFDYTTYTWTFLLKANQPMVVKYLFGGTSTTYTVDLGQSSVEQAEEGTLTYSWYPVADQAFRKGNTSQSGTGGSFEIRNESGTDCAFIAGIKFGIEELLNDNMKVEEATLRLVTIENGGDVAVYPFATSFGEQGGSADSYAAHQDIIGEALASDPLLTFKVCLGGGKKIFEWVPSASTQYTIADWTVNLDITDYLRQCIEAGKDQMAILLAPAGSSTTRSTVLSKDADDQTFGTGTTDELYLDGDNIGQKTGNKVSRWSRLLEVLAQDDSPLSALYPKLTVKMSISEASGIETMNIDHSTFLDGPSGKAERNIEHYYDLQGRRVVPSQMKRGLYIVNGKKKFVR